MAIGSKRKVANCHSRSNKTVENQISFYQANQPDETSSLQNSEPVPFTQEVLKQRGADWTTVFNDLKNAITLRHYSPATLRTYTGWTRKFQTYTKSKDPRLLAVDDVKTFLTWLAVDQRVSASSQNQAFNTLLFL